MSTATTRELHHWRTEETGYSHIQGTKPQTLAYALTDSPAGLAAWIAEKFHSWTDQDGELETAIELDWGADEHHAVVGDRGDQLVVLALLPTTTPLRTSCGRLLGRSRSALTGAVLQSRHHKSRLRLQLKHSAARTRLGCGLATSNSPPRIGDFSAWSIRALETPVEPRSVTRGRTRRRQATCA